MIALKNNFLETKKNRIRSDSYRYYALLQKKIKSEISVKKLLRNENSFNFSVRAHFLMYG